MGAIVFTCERCKRKTEIIAVLVEGAETMHVCPVCLEEDKELNRRMRAGPSEVKNGTQTVNRPPTGC